LNQWEKGILYLTIVLTALVLGKLLRTGLYRPYKLLFCYLLADFFSSIAGATVPYNTRAYIYTYFSIQTIKIIAGALVLIEIYSLALERHRALARFGRNTLGYILGAAGVIPLIQLWRDYTTSTGAHKLLPAFFLFEQTIDGTMATFLILISIFMAWFPVRLRRNVIVYITGFMVWWLSRAAVIHIVNLWVSDKTITEVASVLQMCIGLGCLTYWLIGFQREGESRTAVVGHLWDRSEAERLTAQLDAINNSLERLRRR
jgi:hypothetical protein